MKCPACPDTDLVMTDRQGIEIDYCPKCRGVWLDRGELDKIIERSATAEAPSAARDERSRSDRDDDDRNRRRGRDDDDDDDDDRRRGRSYDDDDRRRGVGGLFGGRQEGARRRRGGFLDDIFGGFD